MGTTTNITSPHGSELDPDARSHLVTSLISCDRGLTPNAQSVVYSRGDHADEPPVAVGRRIGHGRFGRGARSS
ncbi:hypothetical protein B1T45_04775 [Mycobacterium kansasii]|uniref:Uncharacterized protein n=1 Tax=Mycobacterium kansasii ATCC 12478 TaxID=557599 RepID=U5X280_MYCKA|nr:hypothetical protein MKAN_24380 [Mycobacterium kansasii ATCC 12478]ARG55284.1 hypothetical protein B1T43_04720 [Mycobacterium kansasii]ARG60735.1 hypothetical protein B1T45_04775 [Mycobacterium kansasii]ARG76938.1 hypothetical protein B1T51_23520 [Mycobacterium kansasii]ARG82471.1 hypothetical protein B1T52_23910 [Mycobacterium kansasii]